MDQTKHNCSFIGCAKKDRRRIPRPFIKNDVIRPKPIMTIGLRAR